MMRDTNHFDLTYLRMAKEWSYSSYAKKLQVGCLIVKDRTIISDGFNGMPKGLPNNCEDRGGKTYPEVLHAESNAITKLARTTASADGATIYITHPPCIDCAKLIVQSGIVRVVYGEVWPKQKTDDGLRLLANCNIDVEYLEYRSYK